MIKPNWDLFKAKFHDNPQDYFEWFCYMLFCNEIKVSYIHRYKNQAAIETDPIRISEEIIGWQAKFYDTPLTNHKSDFLEMLNRINKYYPNITKVLIYTNQEWGQYVGAEPQGKIEIEKKASDNSVTIDWRTASFFESPFVSIENSMISKHFFLWDRSILDLVNDMNDHTQRILDRVNTNIRFKDKNIRLDRKSEMKLVKDSDKQIIIISGFGGVGKTAIIKDLYQTEDPESYMYLFKASEFELSTIDELFYGLRFNDFIEFHKDLNNKTFVIDSAEKLLYLKNTEPFNEFLTIALKENWKIIFTSRDSYVEDLNFRFAEAYGIYPENINISGIRVDELENLSKEFDFKLPDDSKVISLISNPFYLNEYLKNYQEDELLGYMEFKEKLWNQGIKKAKGIREQNFIKIVTERVNSGHYFINPEIDKSVLQEFEDDGLLGYELSGYFISHDIYEEWALEKYIEIHYNRSVAVEVFFNTLGSALPIRRALRNWVSDKILTQCESITTLVNESLFNDQIYDFWKDEIIVAILLSSYSNVFMDTYRKRLLEHDATILKRCCKLLQISCKSIDKDLVQKLINHDSKVMDYYFTKPIGEGWKAIIKFVYDNIEIIGMDKLGFYINILYDWNSKHNEGETTKYASLISLKYYQGIIKNKVFISNNDFKNSIISTIIYGSAEIKPELNDIVDEIVKNMWINHNDPYKYLCDYCLSELGGIHFARALPERYLDIAKLFWFKDEYSTRSIYSFREDLEDYFGVKKDYQTYYPASAYQTHILNLLGINFKGTLDFVIDFANETTKSYIDSALSENEIIKVTTYLPNDITKELYVSHRLWCMYRGTQVAPNILESIHMALERWLYEIGEHVDEKIFSSWLMYILIKSNSATLHAIVCGIVNAYPNKTYEVAKLLFRTKEFFFFDKSRLSLDRTGKSLFSLGYGMNAKHKYHQDERLNSFDFKNRYKSIEDTFLVYLLGKDTVLEEEELNTRRDELYKILDEYYSEIERGEVSKDFDWRLTLARMDLRKMDIESEHMDEGILLKFNPNLDKDLEEHRLQNLKIIDEKNKFMKLSVWSNFRLKKDERFKEYEEFEENIQLVIDQFLEIKDILENDKDKNLHMIQRSLPCQISSILLRDFIQIIPEYVKVLCKDVILSSVKIPFSKEYGYQIGDGIDIAISTLPVILKEFEDTGDEIKLYLCLTLFDEHSMGANGEFSEYAINAVKDTLLSDRIEWIEGLIFAYLYLAPKYEVYKEKKYMENRQNFQGHLSQHDLVSGFKSYFAADISKAIYSEIGNDDLDEIDKIEMSIARKAFSLIPINTNSDKLFEMQKQLSHSVMNKLLVNDDDKIDYMLRYNFLKDFTELVLNSSSERRELLMQPVYDKFEFAESVQELIKAFIRIEDKCNCYNAFWDIWRKFKDVIIPRCQAFPLANIEYSYEYRQRDTMLKSILLANLEWNKSAKEWHTLKDEDYVYFDDFVDQLPNYPAVIYSIALLIDGIGSRYFRQGITWISKIIASSNGFENIEIDSNTMFLIESVVRKYVLLYRDEIRRKRSQLEEVIIILNWLVKRGSVIGYMVREDIL